MQCLSEREQYVLIHTYGLGGEQEMSLDEIGSAVGLSRERVRQIREKQFANYVRMPMKRN